MPGSIRLFVDAPLHQGAAVAASPAQAHYLGRVMRRGAGDAVLLFNGRDGEWRARIGQLSRDAVVLDVAEQVRGQSAEPDLWLLFAPLKRDLTELVAEKATELGASLIRPVLTARTNPGRVNLDRLALIATEAAEQCERLSVPAIAQPLALPELLQDWPAARSLVVAIERGDAPPVVAPAGPAALLVGPEGGFAPEELDALRRHAFVVPASLGPRILRAETAAIVGLALLQARPAACRDR
jgi:16S rRNA (uracil1498-N3)-methyltransferase